MASNYDRSIRGPSVGGPSSSSSRHRPGGGGPSSSSHRPGGDGPRSSSHRLGGGGPSSSSRGPVLSFLFVVNKLRVRTDGPYVPPLDHWGNFFPPYDRHAYVGEEASRVMRYEGGQVTLAEGHTWHRPHGFNNRGYIVGPSRPAGPHPFRYKSRTVFSCSPFLPIISAPADMTTHDIDGPNGYRWDLLRFEHDPLHPGVSFAASGQQGHHSTPRQYVAGQNPSWIPSLVPEIYLSSYGVPDSRGLGGDLPLLLALMSFSHRRSTPHDVRMRAVFYGGDPLWRDRRWWGDPNARPAGYSRCEDTPRGFLVHICLDNVYNPEGSTGEAMMAFERSVIVQDSH